MMSAGVDGPISISKAYNALCQVHGDAHEARLELIGEMSAGRLASYAKRWVESGSPKTFKRREVAIVMHDGRTLIPRDFWMRGHAFEIKMPSCLPGQMLPATHANWRLERFETRWSVEGGRANWSDRWGANQTGDGPKIWIWDRTAIGITLDLMAFETILSAYPVSSETKSLCADPAADIARRQSELLRKQRRASTRSYAVSDAPLVDEAIELMRSGEARSAHHAAGQLVSRIKGSGTPETKIDRLGRAIRDRINVPGKASS